MEINELGISKLKLENREINNLNTSFDEDDESWMEGEIIQADLNDSNLLHPYLFSNKTDNNNDLLKTMKNRLLDVKKKNKAKKDYQNEQNDLVKLEELLHEEEDELMDELEFYNSESESDDDLNDTINENNPLYNSLNDNLNKNKENQMKSAWIEIEKEKDTKEEIDNKSNEFIMKEIKTPSGIIDYASAKEINVDNFNEIVPEMAITYPFELDDFQKQAIVHIENKDSVFVAAHTSAGKTVVAEYAIAKCRKNKTRAVYTSPIKALSNQKFREFKDKFSNEDNGDNTFEDVGIITGDVSINPEASCLIVTTEILRSMLYKGADMIRDIEWVIFDEIHYINDVDRGVVWEEVIIMLPDHVGMIFLSATTPNTLEFSEWIGRTKKRKIHVISTKKRPIPLQHYLYINNFNNNNLVKVMSDETFIPSGHSQALKLFESSSAVNESSKNRGKNGGRGGSGTNVNGNRSGRGGSGKLFNSKPSGNHRKTGIGGGNKAEWIKTIKYFLKQDMLPLLVFCFSKKLCEECSTKLNSIDLTTASEKSKISVFLHDSINNSLQGSDRELPQVLKLKDMLLRGIGIHHGGLLPIIKEIVEILFSRNLVKVLFSTETFAMGVNMPARTVLFNGYSKHDGKSFRKLLPGEYTQMSGRAGRRGVDSVGIVVIACFSDVPILGELRMLLQGKSTKLESQFRLTYNMILNLMRVEDLRVEDMMKRSFSEFRTQKMIVSRNIPQVLQKYTKMANKLRKEQENDLFLLCSPQYNGNDDNSHHHNNNTLKMLQEYCDIKNEIHRINIELVDKILSSDYANIALCSGRVATIDIGNSKNAVAIILSNSIDEKNQKNGSQDYVKILRRETLDKLPNETNSSISSKMKFQCVFFCNEDFVPLNLTKNEEINGDSKSVSSALDFFSSKKPVRVIKKQHTQETKKEFELGKVNKLFGKTFVIMEIPASKLVMITKEKHRIEAKSIIEDYSLSSLEKTIEILNKLNGSTDSYNPSASSSSLLCIEPSKDLKWSDLIVADLYRHMQCKMKLLESYECHKWPQIHDLILKYDKINHLNYAIEKYKTAISDNSLTLFPDFTQRLNVLKKMNYISQEDNIVTIKGRVACEIRTCDELILTEIIFENLLADLEPEEIMSILSCLIFQEKNDDIIHLTERLEEAKENVINITEALGVIQLENIVDIDLENYCNLLNFGLAEVVYEWARGMQFKDICELTSVQEGTIVRCITRLDEVCKEVRNAARLIGDPILFKKMQVASELIKRDVVFATSLYLK